VAWRAQRDKRRGETRQQARDRLLAELADDVTGNTGNTLNNLKHIDELSPGTSAAMAAASARGRQFLKGKAQEIFGVRAPRMHGKAAPPPVSQLRKWERYVVSVEDPGRVIEQVFDSAAGHAEVETLRTVYPRLYRETVAAIGLELATYEGALSRPVQMQLSALLGTTLTGTDGAQVAQQVAARDMQTAGLPQPSNPAGTSGTFNRRTNMDVRETHETPGQRAGRA